MAAILPQFQSDNTPFQLMQSKWASQLNPLLSLPLNSPSFLKGINLATGVNVINHKLGRSPQGWIIVDSDASITAFRSAAFNDLTLTLTSSGIATVAIMVF